MKKKSRPLSSDELGRRGERIFPTLCNNLVVNQSKEDLVGWDFTVDLANDFFDDAQFLDSIDDKLSCRIQLKTIWHDTKTVNSPLKAMQRLIGYSGPAFVVVIKMSEELDVVDVLIKHLIDNSLEEVLGKISTQKSTQKISNKKVSLPLKHNWHSVDFKNFNSLFNYFDEVMSSYQGNAEYALEKSNQKKTLGYDSSGSKVRLKFNNKDVSDIFDALLGIKPIDIEEGVLSATRFGVEKEINRLPSGSTVIANIDDSSGVQCTLKVISEENLSPRVLLGRLIAPSLPHVNRADIKFRFITGAVSIVFFPYKQDDFSLSIDSEFKQSLHIWKQQFNFILTLTEGGASIEFLSSYFDNKISIIQTERLIKFTNKFKEFPEAVEKIKLFLDKIGQQNINLSLSDIHVHSKQLVTGYHLMDQQNIAIKLEMEHVDTDNLKEYNQVCFVRRVRFEDADIVYASATEVLHSYDDKKSIFFFKKFIGFDFISYNLFDLEKIQEKWEKQWGIEDFLYDIDDGLYP